MLPFMSVSFLKNTEKIKDAKSNAKNIFAPVDFNILKPMHLMDFFRMSRFLGDAKNLGYRRSEKHSLSFIFLLFIIQIQ